MTLSLFQYGLPLVFAYTLFIALAGRMNPFFKPENAQERPILFLGLWSGLSAALALGASLSVGYSMTMDAVRTMLAPSVGIMAILMLPGIAAYSIYRRHISHTQRPDSGTSANHTQQPSPAEDSRPRVPERLLDNVRSIPVKTDPANSHSSVTTIDTLPMAAFAENSATLQNVDYCEVVTSSHDTEEKTAFPISVSEQNRQDEEQSLEDFLHEALIEEYPFDLDDAYEQQADSVEPLLEPSLSLPGIDEYTHQSNKDTYATDSLHDDQALPSGLDAESPLHRESSPAIVDPSLDETQLLMEDATGRPYLLSMDENMTEPSAHANEQAEHLPQVGEEGKSAVDTDSLMQRLFSETQAHAQTRRQLQVTQALLTRLARKPLKNSKPECRSDTIGTSPNSPTDEATRSGLTRSGGTPSGLTRSGLTRSHDVHASNHSMLEKERSQRLRAEAARIRLQKELVRAKADIRRGMSARARALSTANKAIGMARQSIQSRSRLEEELTLARKALTQQQEIISSIIKELESVRERAQITREPAQGLGTKQPLASHTIGIPSTENPLSANAERSVSSLR